MRSRLAAAAAIFLLTSTAAAAQGIGGGASQGTQQRPATPARDTSATPKKGTAIIRGRVVAADTGRPLRRARIAVRPTAPERAGTSAAGER